MNLRNLLRGGSLSKLMGQNLVALSPDSDDLNDPGFKTERRRDDDNDKNNDNEEQYMYVITTYIVQIVFLVVGCYCCSSLSSSSSLHPKARVV